MRLLLAEDEVLLSKALTAILEGNNYSVELKKRSRSISLDVFNTTQAISEENLNNLFDRFYRADPSRNSQTGALC